MALVPASVAVLLVLAAFSRLRRTWPDTAQAAGLALPLAAAAALALGPPEAAAHERAGSLRALRAEPFRLADPGRQGTLFDLAAWPAALLLGDERAVRLVAAVSAGGALLLVYALCRSAGLGRAASLAGQAALPWAPALALGAGPALFGHALSLALELLLLVHLVRRLAHLEGARDNAGAFAYLLLAQAAGPRSTLEVAALVGVLALLEALAGGARRALRLAASWAVSGACVLAARYLPLWLDWPAGAVAASADASPRAAAVALAAAAAGTLAPWLLPRTTRAPRVLLAALAAGLGCLSALPVVTQSAGVPGLGLLAPAAAAGLAAAAARVTSRTSAAAGPGSRSSPSTR